MPSTSRISLSRGPCCLRRVLHHAVDQHAFAEAELLDHRAGHERIGPLADDSWSSGCGGSRSRWGAVPGRRSPARRRPVRRCPARFPDTEGDRPDRESGVVAGRRECGAGRYRHEVHRRCSTSARTATGTSRAASTTRTAFLPLSHISLPRTYVSYPGTTNGVKNCVE